MDSRTLVLAACDVSALLFLFRLVELWSQHVCFFVLFH